MISPHRVTADFEKELCEYTGARYAVAVNSCTAALFLALKYELSKPDLRDRFFFDEQNRPLVMIPKFTYCSVPMQILHAGGAVDFYEERWRGMYRLFPTRVYDAARRFTSRMYERGTFQCVSFHWSKILGIQQGGAILHDDERADAWFRRARFDGRKEGVAPKDDKFILGYHCYMSPEVAAEGLMRLSLLPAHNDDLPNSDYPDLSKQEIFQ